MNRFAGVRKFKQLRSEPNVRNSVKNTAFTLAEVLITLGIIGVVAAVTMPTLVQNYRKHVVETKLKRFYSISNQAIQRAEIDYGDKSLWETPENGWLTDENGNTDYSKSKYESWFYKYIAPYYKNAIIKKVSDNDGRFFVIYFPDGSVAQYSPMSIYYFVDAKNYNFILPEHGIYQYNKNDVGTKIFTFHFAPNSTYYRNKGIEPYKWNWDGSESMLRNNNTIGCKKDVSKERAFCTALIQLNGWKIPKDYPIRF